MINIFDPYKTVCDAYYKYEKKHNLKNRHVKVIYNDNLKKKLGVYGYTVKFPNLDYYIVSIDTTLPLFTQLDTLAHELAHVGDGLTHRHNKAFKRIYTEIVSEFLLNITVSSDLITEDIFGEKGSGWIKPSQGAKFHLFVKGNSACGKYYIGIENYEFSEPPKDERCKECQEFSVMIGVDE